MKKIMILTLCLSVLGLATACADNNRVIDASKLPQTAKQFIERYFPAEKVVIVTEDKDTFGKTYEVVFADGTNIDFDSKGQWKDIERTSAIPAGIVPEALAAKVKELYPQASIIGIDRDKRGYDLKLDNRMELTFDSKYTLKEVDD